MTLEQAVAILNERKHNGCNQWFVDARGEVQGGLRDTEFTAFEAIAIAEKYAGGWVSVEERLPKRGVKVLAANSAEVQVTELDFDGREWAVGLREFHPSHWQPLPEPPAKTH